MTETPQQYKARILGLLAGHDVMALLAAAPARLASLVEGVPAPALGRRPAPERWSIREIVAHLADAELVGAYRYRLILASPGTAIQGYDQEAWAETGRYGEADADAALARFRVLREANVALLQGLDDEAWARTGLHAERGPESIRDLAALYAGHDLNHFAQIEAIRAA